MAIVKPVTSKSLTIHGLNGDLLVSERVDRNGIELELSDELGARFGMVHLSPAAWQALMDSYYSLASQPPKDEVK